MDRLQVERCTHPPGCCANEQGFSFHAEVCCAAHQRKKLEHLCCYITRPAVANERLALNRSGQVVLTLKTPYREGTTHIVMSPSACDVGAAAIALHENKEKIKDAFEVFDEKFSAILTPEQLAKYEALKEAARLLSGRGDSGATRPVGATL